MDPSYRNNFVAVVYCSEQGDGWFSKNTQYRNCLTDPELICLVRVLSDTQVKLFADSDNESLKQDIADVVFDIRELSYRKWPDGNWNQAEHLLITYIPKGASIIVDNYHGEERITVLGNEEIIHLPEN